MLLTNMTWRNIQANSINNNIISNNSVIIIKKENSYIY